jgi:hypothetical protein
MFLIFFREKWYRYLLTEWEAENIRVLLPGEAHSLRGCGGRTEHSYHYFRNTDRKKEMARGVEQQN